MKALFTKLLCVSVFLFAAQLVQAQDVRLNVNSPASIAGNVAEVGQTGTSFGFSLAPGQSVTGDLAWVRSIESDSLGCDSLSNAAEIAGNIALVRRGECFFSDKVWYAQQAGAVAVIICNANEGEGVIPMGAGGEFAGLDTIPAVMISFEFCAQVADAINDGETINVTFAVPDFFGPVASYCYHTPVTQVIPMDAMEVKIVNTADTPVDANVTAAITDPDGMVTELTTTASLDPGQLDTVFFDPFLPTIVGEYNIEFTSDISSEVLTSSFVITEHTWATDQGGDLTFGISNNTSFVDGGLIIQTSSLCINNDQEAIATYASFGIDNPEELISGDPNADVFTAILYDADVDMDNVLDIENSFDDMLPIATGTFVLTEEYEAGSVVSLPLESFTGDPVMLAAGQPYYISILYDGVNSGLGISPIFTSSNDIEYPINLTTALFIDQLYSGWGGATNVVRLHIEGFDPTSTVDRMLEGYKVSLAPNPATELVQVTFDLDEVADDVVMNIYDFGGKVVRSERRDGILNDTVEFNVSDLPAGTYFMSILTPEGFISKKFVVAE